ncbi:MAG: hypothetical protein MK081_08550 [Flavobacteriales bacterium]|nr:hypothetical protein [Flavobacteriales bacterium]
MDATAIIRGAIGSPFFCNRIYIKLARFFLLVGMMFRLKYVLKALIVTGIFLCSYATHSQSNLRLSVPFRLEGGVNFATIKSDSTNAWNQGIGVMITAGSGIGIRWKESWGALVEAGILANQHDFTSREVDYGIAYVGLQFRGNIHFQIPRKKESLSPFRIDLEGGWTPFDNTTTKTSEEADDWTITTSVLSESRAFIAPGIGFADQLRNGEISFALTYKHHFGQAPHLQTTFDQNGIMAKAHWYMDFLGIGVRWMYDVKGHLPYQTPTVEPPLDHSELASRQNRPSKEIAVKTDRLVIKLWDNGTIDGDTVSVMVNGRYILKEHALTDKRKKIKIKLVEGSNSIIIIAHNEGSVSPNTAACLVRSGWRREEFVVSTGLDRNSSIEVVY